MLKTYAVNVPGTEQVVICGIDTDLAELPHSPFLEIPEGNSTLAARYAVVDGEVVDHYQGYTDEEVLELLEAGAPPPSLQASLDDLKQEAIQMARGFFEDQVCLFKSDAAPYEVATWETQRIEYSEWVKDHDAPIPYCRALAAGRGIALDVLMEKIYIKITRLAAAQGQQHALETAILNAASPEELSAVLAALPS